MHDVQFFILVTARTSAQHQTDNHSVQQIQLFSILFPYGLSLSLCKTDCTRYGSVPLSAACRA